MRMRERLISFMKMIAIRICGSITFALATAGAWSAHTADKELVESFRSHAGYSVTPMAPLQIDAAIEAILGLEKVRDVSAIARLLIV